MQPNPTVSVSSQHLLWHVLLFPAVLLLETKTGEPVVFPGHMGGMILRVPEK